MSPPAVSHLQMHAYTLDDGMQVFWLRLTPPLSQPLAPAPGTAEITVTGMTVRARATITTGTGSAGRGSSGGCAGLRFTCTVCEWGCR